jgi:hypothetical protein
MTARGVAAAANMNLCALESYTMRLAPCWDGELDAIGAYSQLAYVHEKAHGAEEAAAEIREAIERLVERRGALDEGQVAAFIMPKTLFKWSVYNRITIIPTNPHRE